MRFVLAIDFEDAVLFDTVTRTVVSTYEGGDFDLNKWASNETRHIRDEVYIITNCGHDNFGMDGVEVVDVNSYYLGIAYKPYEENNALPQLLALQTLNEQLDENIELPTFEGSPSFIMVQYWCFFQDVLRRIPHKLYVSDLPQIRKKWIKALNLRGCKIVDQVDKYNAKRLSVQLDVYDQDSIIEALASMAANLGRTLYNPTVELDGGGIRFTVWF